MGVIPTPQGRTIMRACCNAPSWARWQIVDDDEVTVLAYTMTLIGARLWRRRYRDAIFVTQPGADKPDRLT